ncbi:MAG: hypothetical protein A2096_05515, partial [Spirochaetes bacterium GWF1_41_5]
CEKIHGKGWTEWRVAQHAAPRFEGHCQPKVPLWGYQDESDLAVMAQKIDAATAYGIDAFIFDWYYFKDGLYRERCLNDGFLEAYNCEEIKFALMWANHHPHHSHPGTYAKPHEPAWSGTTDPDTFRRCTDYCIEHYLTRPNYLKIDGKLYYSIFLPEQMAIDVGGVDVLRSLLDDFRARVNKAGLGQLLIDARVDGLPKINDGFDKANKFLLDAGFDITSNYGWGGHYGPEFPALDYGVWFERNKPRISDLCDKIKLPFNPVACMGWDCSPRTVQSDMFENVGYPFGTIIVNNTPERFEKALRWLGKLTEEGKTGGMITLACWNEWTEGSYLEPDTQYGYGYLNAIKNVFGKAEED